MLLEQFFFSNEEKIKDPSASPPLQNPPTSSPQQQEAYQSQPKPYPQAIAANIIFKDRTLFLKKKDEIVNTFPILSQKNADITIIAENKFNEIRRIYLYI